MSQLVELQDVVILDSLDRAGGRRCGSGREVVEIDRVEVVHAG
ncbi:hypothetical protein WME88_56465 [Sorangium sp. So ce216]